MTRGIDGDFGVLNTRKILKKVVAHPNKRDRADEYEKFCSFIVRFNSTHPVYMFNRTHYDTDALVRHMFFLQLSEYKPCERITDCPVVLIRLLTAWLVISFISSWTIP